MIGSGIPTEPDQITQRTLPEDAIGAPYFYYEQIHLSNPMIGFGVHTKSDQITQRTLPEDAIGFSYFYYEQIYLSNPMIGFGVHTKLDQITQRTLAEDAIGAPYFYYENVALAPVGSAKLTERICKALEAYDDKPPSSVYNDAEVAFYCLGISLKTDVQELNDDRLEQLMSRFGGFDLVVSGIQRNNLTGRNKHHQDGLEDFCCNLLKDIMDIILSRKFISMEKAAMLYQDLSQNHDITRVQVDFGKVGSFKLVQYFASGFH
ncbi:polyribonucleotide nucleotidyltransferase 2 [Hibiscus syriacus]|uniref:Polyribonucleotide nucleotidyltransferase 2 n=1 Tax=Hibiscus syriacus TaxID=106335 RepID=A0A6A2YK78_HIBSY|nr:polyribonucleotide nucleotidyltransferase 2 [Hibiscus syriacus]